MSIEELKRENEILKDALCMEQDRLSHARHHIQNAQDRIKRLEEVLMDAKNKHAALVADVALYEDRGERIKRLEDRIRRASIAFFEEGSGASVASGMLAILEEERGKP